MADENVSKAGLYEIAPTIKDTDFIGFTFGKFHSSTFGIVRISEGSRYNENLLPTIQDKTVQIPGGDGFYYFGSYYTQRQFNISFAFDALTETNFRRLKKWLSDKNPKDLIFDEAPYKIYKAKVTGSATIKHICFMENNERVYKAEGSVQFTCYNPFARSRFKYLDEYSDEDFLNKSQWSLSSGLLPTQGIYDKLKDQNKIPLYNGGDLETDFTLTIIFQGDSLPSGSIKLATDSSKKIETGVISKEKIDDWAIRFNSKNNLIEGINENGQITGSLYNQYITDGDFFKIPLGEEELILTNYPVTIETDNGEIKENIEIKYDYLYF